jgi:hypothetical protein
MGRLDVILSTLNGYLDVLAQLYEAEGLPMPKILDKRVSALKKAGKSTSSAYAIATKTLQKEGKLKKGIQKIATKGKKA